MPNFILSATGLSQLITAQQLEDHHHINATAASVTIHVTLPTRTIAPIGVFFDAEVSGFSVQTPSDQAAGFDPTKTEIVYRWKIAKLDATGQLTEYQPIYDVPQDLFDRHRDAATLFGANVAHMFEQPGRYQVTVEASQAGTAVMAIDSVTLQIEDPEDVYTDQQTIYVHPTQDWSLAPAGAQVASQLSSAVNAARGMNLPVRIMLADDVMHLSTNTQIHDDTPDILVTRSGFGTNRPQMSYDYANAQPGQALISDRGTRAADNGNALKLSEIDFVGYWDSRTNTLNSPATQHSNIIRGLNTVDGCYQFFLAHNCSATGFHLPYRLETRAACYSGITITNWQNLALFTTDHGHLAVLGSSIRQDPLALSGKGAKDGTINEHGPVRIQENRKTFFDGCEFFSRNGWTTFSGVDYQNGEIYAAEQPCIRYNQNQLPGGVGNFQRCRMEGGGTVFYAAPVNPTVTANVQTILIERCEFIGSHQTSSFVSTASGGLVVRNNHMLHVNTERSAIATDPDYGVEMDDRFTISAGTGDAPIRVHHNTLVNLCDPTNEVSNVGVVEMVNSNYNVTKFTDVVYESNIVHAPLEDHVPYGPLSTLARPDADHLGYALDPYTDAPVAQPWIGATPPGTIALYYPAEESPAVGAGSPDADVTLSLDILYDFAGDQRPLVASIGALERF